MLGAELPLFICGPMHLSVGCLFNAVFQPESRGSATHTVLTQAIYKFKAKPKQVKNSRFKKHS